MLRHAAECAARGNSLWLDHCGTTTYEGQLCFVTEPYLGPTHLESAAQFAELLGLRWKLDENSWWYPNNTTRIVFFPPDGPGGQA